MRVLLIAPDFVRPPANEGEYAATFNIPSYGLNMIATCARAHGHEVDVVDSLSVIIKNGPDAEISVEREALAKFASEDYDLVGMGVTSPTRIIAYRLSQRIKKIARTVPIVWGGPHVSALGAEIARCYRGLVDVVVIGQGECAFPRLLNDLEGGRIRIGDSEQTLCINGFADEICLDDLAQPDYSVGYSAQTNPHFDTAPIMTARGCWARCSYCFSAVHWRQNVDLRSTESVVGEVVRYMDEYGISKLHFGDDVFGNSLERAKAILSRLAAENVHASSFVGTRADIVDQEMIDLLSQCGGGTVYVGLESGSDSVLRRMSKGISIEKCERVLASLKRNNNTRLGIYVIFGFPGESIQDRQRTVEVVSTIGADEVTCNIAHVHPKTRLFRQAQSEGVYEIADWLKLDNDFFPYVKDPVEYAELRQFCADVEGQFGNRIARAGLLSDVGTVR